MDDTYIRFLHGSKIRRYTTTSIATFNTCNYLTPSRSIASTGHRTLPAAPAAEHDTHSSRPRQSVSCSWRSEPLLTLQIRDPSPSVRPAAYIDAGKQHAPRERQMNGTGRGVPRARQTQPQPKPSAFRRYDTEPDWMHGFWRMYVSATSNSDAIGRKNADACEREGERLA
jgi:hypothetical protein